MTDCANAAVLLLATQAAAGALFTVTTNSDSGPGSLRQAMLDAGKTSGTNTIVFNILGRGPFTIALRSGLPFVYRPVVIDGTTQPGYVDTPIIELEGSRAGPAEGLYISAGNTVVRGLAINRCLGGRAGILLTSAGNNVIEGCFIGTDVAGTGGFPTNSGWGIVIINSTNNVIGGTNAAARNVISGNRFAGIDVEGGASSGNKIVGNFVGTDVTGTVAIGNGNGVQILDGFNNTVGGTNSSSRNLLSGNGTVGVRLGTVAPGGPAGNQVQGNFIGTDVSGTVALGSQYYGVSIGSNENVIGGTNDGAGNLISGNRLDGIIFTGQAATNRVEGNWIGTDATGRLAVANSGNGIHIYYPARNNRVGGTNGAARNVVSGNGRNGVQIDGASGNVIQSNFIGTDIDGTANLGNAGDGILITSNAFATVIGGTAPGLGNTIAFNASNGVAVVTGTRNAIRGNAIFNNVGLGIDLGRDGVTLNHPGGTNSGPNSLQNFPILSGAMSSGSQLNIFGALNSRASANFSLDFFLESVSDPTGFGQGQIFLGSYSVTTDPNGDTNITVTFTTSALPGQWVTASATDAVNNTSEFSNSIEVKAGVLTPKLLVAKSDQANEIVLSWQKSDGFLLETTDALSLPPIWSPVAQAPLVAGELNLVRLPIDIQSRFYRLRKP